MILIVGQTDQPTGMARVTRAIARHLSTHRAVHVLGIDAFARSGPVDMGGWTLHPNPARHDIFAEAAIARLVAALNPRAVLYYHDPWLVPRMARAQGAHPALKIGYCPIDGAILRPSIATGLTALDRLVVPTRFAGEAVRQAIAGRSAAQAPVFTDIAEVPHGVDLADFRPLAIPDRVRAARRQLFPEQPALHDGFWVLNANRNQRRKRLDLTLEGFAAFARDKPANVRLYLRWGDRPRGLPVRRMARRLGIADRVILPARRGGPTAELNCVYNACDVGVNTARGEGWGLISFEHAAVGAPQIVGDHSACGELWRGAACLLPPRHATLGAGYVRGEVVGAADLAAALERLYTDRAHRAAVGAACRARALDPRLRWAAIGARWDQILRPWLAAASEPETARRAPAGS